MVTLGSIRGQTTAINLLQASLRSGKMPHAYLFHGMEGVGKKSSALALAKAVNCLAPRGLDACGECRSCRKIDSNSHPDVVQVRASGVFIRIEQIRSLQKELMYKPLEGNYRVIIIGDGSLLNRESANCLLKTLEEPPEKSLIIIAATDMSRLLPTIVSRCRAVPFNPLSPDEIAAHLLSLEDGRCAEEAAIMALLSGGSLGRAAKLASVSSLLDRKEILRQLGSLSRENLDKALLLAERLAAQKEGFPEILTFIKAYLRDVFFVKKNVPEDYIINKDLRDHLARSANQWTGEALMNTWDLLGRAEEAPTRNYNRQLILENAFLHLAGF